MEDKLIEACLLALEVGVLILGGVVTGVLTIMIMSHVIDMPMPGRVMTFVCAVGTYGFICWLSFGVISYAVFRILYYVFGVIG